MKTTLLITASLLLSATSFAQGYHPATPPGGTAYGVTYGNGNDRRDNRWNNDDDDDFDDDYYQRAGWRRGNRHGGHYEQRSVQQWVPGTTTQVWAPGFCHRPPFAHVQVCTPGRYVNQTTPGYYRSVQQWVWVEHHRRGNRWGRR